MAVAVGWEGAVTRSMTPTSRGGPGSGAVSSRMALWPERRDVLGGAVSGAEGWPDAFGDDGAQELGPAVDVGGDVGVADAGEGEGFVAGDAGAFEFDGVLVRGLEAGALHADAAFVQGGVGGVGDVEGPGRFPHAEG